MDGGPIVISDLELVLGFCQRVEMCFLTVCFDPKSELHMHRPHAPTLHRELAPQILELARRGRLADIPTRHTVANAQHAETSALTQPIAKPPRRILLAGLLWRAVQSRQRGSSARRAHRRCASVARACWPHAQLDTAAVRPDAGANARWPDAREW